VHKATKASGRNPVPTNQRINLLVDEVFQAGSTTTSVAIDNQLDTLVLYVKTNPKVLNHFTHEDITAAREWYSNSPDVIKWVKSKRMQFDPPYRLFCLYIEQSNGPIVKASNATEPDVSMTKPVISPPALQTKPTFRRSMLDVSKERRPRQPSQSVPTERSHYKNVSRDQKSFGIPRTFMGATKVVLHQRYSEARLSLIGILPKLARVVKGGKESRPFLRKVKRFSDLYDAVYKVLLIVLRNHHWANNDKRTLGIRRLLADFMVQVWTRGCAGVFTWAKRLAFNAESSLLNDTTPNLWKRYLTGIHKGVLYSRRLVALLATFSRALPPIPDPRAEGKALAKALRAWTKFKKDQTRYLVDTPLTLKLRRDLIKRDTELVQRLRASQLPHPINLKEYNHLSNNERNWLLKMATTGLTMAEITYLTDERFHFLSQYSATLRKEIEEWKVTHSWETLYEANNLRDLRLHDSVYQQLIQAIEKSKKDISADQRKVDLDDIGLFTRDLILALTQKGKNIPPLKAPYYLRPCASFESTRRQGGAESFLKDKMKEELKPYLLTKDGQIKWSAKTKSAFTDDPSILFPGVKHGDSNQQVWAAFLRTLNNNSPKSRIHVIPEKGGKYRVANIADIATNACAGPLGDQVISILKRHPALKGEYENKPQSIANRLYGDRTRPIDRHFYSTDMNQSTDTIRKDIVYRVVDAISLALNWDKEQHQSARRTVEPMELYIEKEDEFGNKTYKNVGRNHCGTLLGLPLSFAILNIVHLYCVNAMTPKGIRRTVVYGDDMATYCSPEDWDAYVTRCNSVGFTLNMNKTHTAEYGFVFCGKIYCISGNHCHWIKAMKLSNVTGSSSNKRTLIEKITQAAEASHMVPQWQAERLLKCFKNKHQVIVKRAGNYGIPFIGPVIGGALGFKGRCDQRTRKIAVLHSKLETNPFAKQLSLISVPSNMRKALSDAYALLDIITSTTHIHKYQIRTEGKVPFMYEDLEQRVVSSTLFDHASRFTALSSKPRKSSHSLSRCFKKFAINRRAGLNQFDKFQSEFNCPRNPSYQFMTKAIMNGNRNGWRFDAEEVGKYLNRLPCRETWSRQRIPNFDMERHIRSIGREQFRSSRTVHSMLALKY
jgi:hypothetical protein